MPDAPLPFPLPYAPNALEPTLSEQTIRLHDQLAAGYAAQFPKAQAGVMAAVQAGAQDLREQLRTLSFQGSGYVLHNIYFANMAPPSESNAPGQAARTMISLLFGSMEDFQKAFLGAANAVEGPGYAIFGWLPATKRPILLQSEEHNNKTVWGVVPILALDVWEHAYMLDYGTDRGAYIGKWWNLINWADVESRCRAAISGQMPMLN